MNQEKTVFSQIMEYLPMHAFRRCVKKYQGNSKVISFSCFDQYLCMAFAQLTWIIHGNKGDNTHGSTVLGTDKESVYGVDKVTNCFSVGYDEYRET